MKRLRIHCILVLLMVICDEGCHSVYMQSYCPCFSEKVFLAFSRFSAVPSFCLL